jgi:hypothetical protein
MHAGHHQPGNVRDIGAQLGPDLVGNLAEFREIQDARIGRRAAPQDLRAVLLGQRPHLGKVDTMIALPHVIADGLEVTTGDTDVGAVRQVSARRQTEAHDGVAGVAERQVGSQIRWAATVGLDVDVLGAEQCL